jgi:hypothetical protein
MENGMAVNEHHFCMLLESNAETDTVHTGTRTRGFVLEAKRWSPREEITIRFLEGDPVLRQRVTDVANEWLDHANLIFRFVDAAPSDIRIAFIPGAGSWSYLGTDARHIDEPKPTMNYGWLTANSDDDEVRRVVLHEFGHALGMIHEHQNPLGGVQWNQAAVIADLGGPPNNWSMQTIENNMFRKYDPAEGIGTQFDGESIMLYPIPAAWTTDGFSSGLNDRLSEDDKLLIEQIYPK